MFCLQIGRVKTPVYRTSLLIVVYVIVGLVIVFISIWVILKLRRRQRGNYNDSCELQMDSLCPETPSPQSMLEDNGSSDFQNTCLEICSVDCSLEDSNTHLHNTNFTREAPSPDSRHIISSPDSRRPNLPMQDFSNGISGPGRGQEHRDRLSDLPTSHVVQAMSDSDRRHESTEHEYVQLTDVGKTFPSPYQSSEL